MSAYGYGGAGVVGGGSERSHRSEFGLSWRFDGELPITSSFPVKTCH